MVKKIERIVKEVCVEDKPTSFGNRVFVTFAAGAKRKMKEKIIDEGRDLGMRVEQKISFAEDAPVPFGGRGK